MSRFMRFAVCAVLGFGVLALLMSDTEAPQTKMQTQMEHILAHVDAQMAAEQVADTPKIVAPKKPKLSEQARRARDRRAEQREERSVRRIEDGLPETDSITVREIEKR